MALPLPDASRRHRSEIYRQSVSFYRVSVIALNDLYGSGDYSDYLFDLNQNENFWVVAE